jgi:hypothetical protein
MSAHGRDRRIRRQRHARSYENESSRVARRAGRSTFESAQVSSGDAHAVGPVLDKEVAEVTCGDSSLLSCYGSLTDLRLMPKSRQETGKSGLICRFLAVWRARLPSDEHRNNAPARVARRSPALLVQREASVSPVGTDYRSSDCLKTRRQRTLLCTWGAVLR